MAKCEIKMKPGWHCTREAHGFLGPCALVQDVVTTPGLLPCPFCGRNDLRIIDLWSEDEPKRTYAKVVYCRDCHAQGRSHYPIGWTESDQAAREAWNDRTEIYLKGAEHQDHLDRCPTYYDGCHCTVEALEHNIKRADQAEAALEEKGKS